MVGKLTSPSSLLYILLILLACGFVSPEALKGQALQAGQDSLPKEWFFAYENQEKALAGDPEASSRLLEIAGPWRFHAAEDSWEDSLSAEFYQPAFDDASWEEVSLPRKTAADTSPSSSSPKSPVSPALSGSSRVLFYRKQITISEAELAANELFMRLNFSVPVSCWVNGQKAGELNAFSTSELVIGDLLQPGENLLAIKAGPLPEAPAAAHALSLSPGMGEVLLYRRPPVAISELGIAASLENNGRRGRLQLDLSIRSRLDSVRERFWGLLKREAYSTAIVKAQLVDSKGDVLNGFDKEEKLSIQGGDRVRLEMEGTVEGVQTWTHDAPQYYRLNIQLLNQEGQVLEVISRQVGFKTIEWKSQGMWVNGTQVPLRIFNPGRRAVYEMQPEELMEEIRRIKRENYNAVYADAYQYDPAWYRLSDHYGVYVLDTAQGVNRSHPSSVSVKAGELPSEDAPAPVTIEMADFLKGTIRLRNDFAFRDLSDHYLEWSILQNGTEVEKGTVQQLQVTPGEQQELRLGYKTRFYQGNDYFLNLDLKNKQADSLFAAGTTLYARQFRLGPYEYEEIYEPAKGMVEVSEGFDEVVVNGYDFRISFDRKTGQIKRYHYKGKELMRGGPELEFNKHLPVADSLKENQQIWNDAVQQGRVLETKITEDVNGNYYISFTRQLLGGDARLFQNFRIDGRGGILVEYIFVKMKGEQPSMPGFGTSLHLPADFEEIEWYGRHAPADSRMGVYSEKLGEEEGATKEAIRWLRVSRKDGYGLLIRKEKSPFNLTVIKDKPAAGQQQLNLDLSRDPLPFKSLNFTYRIIPYTPQSTR